MCNAKNKVNQCVLQEKDLELCAVNMKLDQLEAELQDLNSQESKDETSLAKVWFPSLPELFKNPRLCFSEVSVLGEVNALF